MGELEEGSEAAAADPDPGGSDTQIREYPEADLYVSMEDESRRARLGPAAEEDRPVESGPAAQDSVGGFRIDSHELLGREA